MQTSMTLDPDHGVMEDYSQLSKWAASCGVKINGIAPHDFPGKGLGIIAKKALEAGETIMGIPMSIIRTEYSLPKHIINTVSGCTMNGLLAAELVMDTSRSHALWRNTLPSAQIFQECMPLFYPAELQKLLSTPSKALLKKQQLRLSADWKAVNAAFPELNYDDYVHSWLLISTRTFYYTPQDMLPEDTPEADECLAIVPIGDYFNHAAQGCKVKYAGDGYEFVLETPARKGEELFISYGSHTNDFLLVEYGFVMENNEHDAVTLDEAVLPLFSAEQKTLLEHTNYLGNYTLCMFVQHEDEAVCYRTIVALRLLIMPLAAWKRGLKKGFNDHDQYADKLLELEHKTLTEYLRLVTARCERIETSTVGTEGQRKTLLNRWDLVCGQLEHVLNSIALE